MVCSHVTRCTATNAHSMAVQQHSESAQCIMLSAVTGPPIELVSSAGPATPSARYSTNLLLCAPCCAGACRLSPVPQPTHVPQGLDQPRPGAALHAWSSRDYAGTQRLVWCEGISSFRIRASASSGLALAGLCTRCVQSICQVPTTAVVGFAIQTRLGTKLTAADACVCMEG